MCLQFNLADGAIRVELDLAQFKQLLTSLVSNAAEAIPPVPQGVVRIATLRRSIDPQLVHPAFSGSELPNGTYGCLEVDDRGCGMDEQTRARIFDPFFTTKFPGRGLGLAAAFGIVRGHKGLIAVDSAPGRGTTFQIFFPLSSLEATILIVDPDAAARQAAQQALERCGYRVITADSGQAAIELLQSHTEDIALAVLDWTMHCLSGLANQRPQLRIVLADCFSEAEGLRKFDYLGPAGFLQKP